MAVQLPPNLVSSYVCTVGSNLTADKPFSYLQNNWPLSGWGVPSDRLMQSWFYHPVSVFTDLDVGIMVHSIWCHIMVVIKQELLKRILEIN